jgi:hypothetical protein
MLTVRWRVPWRRVSIAAAAALLGTIPSCAKESPSTEAAPPDVAAPPPPPAATSRFSVPLEYDFTAVLRLVEQIVPHTFGSLDSVKVMGTDTRKHYAFEAVRGPFTAFADGNLLHLRTTIEYSAKAYYKPMLGPTVATGCGEGKERPRVVVELATPIGLTEHYHLVSHARIVKVEPASTEPRDHCEVSIAKVVHMDATDRVMGAARAGLEGQLASIDRKIGGVDLTDRVKGWWGMLARPIKLTDGVWLTLGPQQLRMGLVSGRSKVLTVPVSLDARPAIITGLSAPDSVVPPLPPLARDTAVNGFHVIMDGLVDYGTASRAINAAVGARRFTQSGHTVTLNSVSVLPEPKGRLALALSFTGDATGVLRLVGTPLYDHVHNVIAVPDLDFDLQTDNTLIQTYTWLKSDALRTSLRQKARIPARPVLDKGKALLLEGLNRKLGDAVTLSATVDSIAVRGLFVTRDGVVVRGEATGRAGVAVRQR